MSKKLAVSFLVALSIMASLMCSVFMSGKVSAQSMFEEQNGMVITQDAKVSTECGIPDTRSGLLLEGKQGASVKISKSLQGVFEMDFRVVSGQNFTEDDLAGENNGALDLQTMSITFANEDGKSFSLVIAGSSDDLFTPMAYVSVENGYTYGKTYYKDTETEKNTVYNNYKGLYTKLTGTSFSNFAKIAGSYAAPNSNKIVFNPVTMEVYAYTFGADENVKNKLLIADLKDAAVFGQKGALSAFTEYTVTLAYDKVAGDKTAKTYLYSVNGLDLNGDFENGSSNASVVAVPDVHGVVNEKYLIPTPSVFALTGEPASDVEVHVESNGEAVEVFSADGTPAEVYAKGMYFMPQRAGVYTIGYAIGDGETSLSVDIKVFSVHNGYYLKLDGSYDELLVNKVGVNGKVALYAAKVESGMYYFGNYGDAVVSVYKNGVALGDFDKIAADKQQEFTATESGEYEIKYFEKISNTLLATYAFSVVDSVPSFELPELSDFYQVGTKLVLKDGSASFNNAKKSAFPIVSMPDGSMSSGPVVSLDVAGKYYVSYYAVFESVTYKYVKTLYVADNGGSLFTASEGLSVQSDYTADVYPYHSGLLVTSAKGGTITYNLPIDLNDFTSGSQLIDFTALPTKDGVAEFKKISIALADVNDKNNYFTISLVNNEKENGRDTVSVRAGAYNQPLCGLNNGVVDTSALGGTEIMASFAGAKGFGYDSIKLYYNNKEKAVYVANAVSGEALAVVSSFADSAFYSEKVLWHGFSSDVAILSITIEGQTGVDSKLLIKSIGKQSFEEGFEDSVPPTIQVDFGGYTQNTIPQAYVGMPYPLFKAEAYDSADREEKSVSIHVYKNYGKSDMQLCDSDVYSGVFYPAATGNYAIEYSARDSKGNTAIYCVPFTVEKYYPAPELILGFEMPESLNPGESIDVENYEVRNGSGKLSTKIYLKNVDSDEKVLIEEGPYVVTVPGEYVLYYEVEDYTTIKEVKEFRFTVNDTTVPTFVHLPQVAEYMLNGKEQFIGGTEAVYYDDASNSVKEAEMQIAVEYKGQKTPITGNTFVPQVDANNDVVKIWYTATNPVTGQKTEKTFDVTIINVYDEDEMMKLDRLFLTENIDEVIPSNDKITFVSYGNGSPKISFVNELVANGFALSFKFTQEDAERINYSTIKINMYDAVDSSVSVAFYITKRTPSDTTSYFGINEPGSMEISSTFFGNTNKDFKIRYRASENTVIDGNNANVLGVVTKTQSGMPFNGFPSNFVKFSVELLGVTGQSAVSIQSIGNQPITNTVGDYIAPQLNTLGELNNFVLQGQKVVLPAAVASDVVFGSCNVMVSVVGPDNKAVVKDQSASEPFEFEAVQHGLYQVMYYVTDGSNEYSASYTITARSQIVPEFSVEGDFKNGKVGQEVTVPGIKVTNLPEGEYTAYIVAITPFGDYQLIENGKFVPKYAGKYTIRYFVRDAYYNVAEKDFSITVE